ncbi:MAG: hypothetical protein ACREK8_03070 [Gemmatimonadales bacterium]
MTQVHRSILATLVVCVAGVSTAAAQDTVAIGTVTFHLKMHAPPNAVAMLGEELEMEMTGATDGQHVAMNMVMTGAGTMTGMSTRVIFALGNDTVHMGIVLPPPLANGMPGMRMDVPTAMLGAGNPILGHIMDSVSKALKDPVFRSLGTVATVAGITCAEWEMVAGTDTTRTCVIPTSPALLALQQRMGQMTGFHSMLMQLPGMAEMMRTAYGGKPMTAIRSINARTGTTMELVSVAPGVPDKSIFELPPDLQVMPYPGGGNR